MRNKKARCPLCKTKMTRSDMYGVLYCPKCTKVDDNKFYHQIFGDVRRSESGERLHYHLCIYCGGLTAKSPYNDDTPICRRCKEMILDTYSRKGMFYKSDYYGPTWSIDI